MYPHHHSALLRHSSSSSSSSNMKSKLLIRSCRSAEVQPFMDPSASSLTCPSPDADADSFSLPLVARSWASHAAPTTPQLKFSLNPFSYVASIFRSLLVPTCQPLASAPSTAVPSPTSRGSRRKLTGTFFGQKKGRVSFAVQETPRSEPVLLLELATPTSHLVKEMASGTVRILLECERKTPPPPQPSSKRVALLDEKVWTMYCNGHKLGYAVSRPCTASDSRVLGTVQAVSVGAGVLPGAPPALPPPCPEEGGDCGGGEVMYMRARFERVIGSRDSEAFYMISPDCGGRSGREGSGGGKYSNGGPELSIFLLRI